MITTPKERKLNAQIGALQGQLQKAKDNRRWTCPSCSKKTRISTVELMTEHYYVEPYSCSGGDYWTTEKQPPFHVVCSECTKVHRYCTNTAGYDFLEHYRYSFIPGCYTDGQGNRSKK